MAVNVWVSGLILSPQSHIIKSVMWGLAFADFFSLRCSMQATVTMESRRRGLRLSRLVLLFIGAVETFRNITARVIDCDVNGEIHYFLEGCELANLVPNNAKMVTKNDANLALPPRFRQVHIESPL
ncbi:hypothetical protein TNCV_1485471 [Trichonephila clavipes]|nr:hypothetical protein TNCV_1485471 [Trichonephila clavipes]